LRQVEELTVWILGASKDDPGLAEHAKVCAGMLQRCLPRQKAKDEVRELREKEEFMLRCRRGWREEILLSDS
jgi:hypothetical protein